VNSSQRLTRRRFLLGAGSVAATVAAGLVIDAHKASGTAVPLVALGEQPQGLPSRQFAWEQGLSRDQFGNAVPPRFDRLVMFDVIRTPTAHYARLLESKLRELERSYAWSHEGLLFTVGWSHHYFSKVLGIKQSPVPAPKALALFEQPALDSYDICIHLACDDEQRLATVAHQLIQGLAPALRWRATRTGFAGAGLPAAHQRVEGIPSGNPVSKSSPLFMGFKSALKKNQATEDAVTGNDSQFTDYTTMTVSYMRLSLDSWYRDLTDAQRVGLMYSPQTTPAQVAKFTTDAASNPGKIKQAISKYGVIGHAQATATARVGGKPVILRRDFDTVDGGQAGLHFVSLQRSISDFVRTRTAMNQSSAPLSNPSITDTANNGINAFIFVLNRGNYLVPSRADRSFPLLPGRETGL
jgi:hypothetical protein